ILATQRPSANIITGVIRANFPARFAFKVSTGLESRVILDQNGAEQLIGRGDMLISQGNDFERVQCAFVDTPEVERITRFISEQQGYQEAYALPDPPSEGESDGPKDVDLTKLDPRFEEAAALIVSTQQGSTSMIQRKLSLGYNRAGRLMDQLEVAGIVGPQEGSKPREVKITDLDQLDMIISKLKNQ
ncbi:MAG: DNA translocase FtsK, partial [Paludibacteraceae bacterium]|nr:DNA translocase FtsK [Paludibacteraceae bacterium]